MQGYEHIAQNVRTPYGEVDLVMRDNREYVFVEVKARHTENQGHPSVAVTEKKLQRIQNAAESYLAEHAVSAPWRIDVIALLPGRIEHFKNVTLA